MKLKPRQPILP